MARDYIKPDKVFKKYTCPHCNTVSQVEHFIHNFDSDYYGSGSFREVRNQLTIHRCQCCGRKIIWIDNNYVYPDIVAEEANKDMPDSVKQLYNEAGLIYNKSPRAACALLRLAIDRLCNELGEQIEILIRILEPLLKKDCLNPYNRRWMLFV